MACRDEIPLCRRAILFYSRRQLNQNWLVQTSSTWLVETQNFILSRIAILYYTSPGQVERQMGMRLFSEKNHKNCHRFFSLGRISLRIVSSGDVICILVHAKREVWENSVARERPPSRFGVMSLLLEKVYFAG